MQIVARFCRKSDLTEKSFRTECVEKESMPS